MRKITVVSTQTDEVFNIESSAETWGELSRHERIGGANGMKAMIRETKNTLESAEAILPQGDFTLYLSPSKVKSGWSEDDLDDLRELDEYLYDNDAPKHLQRFVSRLLNNNSSTSTVGVTENAVSSSFPVSLDREPVRNSAKDDLLAEARRFNK